MLPGPKCPEEEVGKTCCALRRTATKKSQGQQSQSCRGTAFYVIRDCRPRKRPLISETTYRKSTERNTTGSFWYRTEFKIPSDFDKEIIWLNFDGINRKGQIYLNGIHLGNLDGFMHCGHFNVTPISRPQRFQHIGPYSVDIPRTPLANQGSPNYLSGGGWDWMPYVPGLNSGITDKVWLENTGKKHDYRPLDEVELVSRSLAELTLQAEVTNNGGSQCTTTVKVPSLRATSHPQSGSRFASRRDQNRQIRQALFPQMVVNNPFKLWWPNGYGEPHLSIPAV